jgi:ADP-heptose:LPS heptosyltransferase
VIDALTRAYPGAEIDYVAEAPARALLEPDPRVDGLFLLGKAPAAVTPVRPRFGGMRDVVGWLRERRAELVLDLFSNPYTALLAWLSGAAWRVGYDRRVRRFAYNVRVPRFRGEPRDDTRWAGEVQLDFLRDAGVRWEGEAKAGVALSDDDRRFAEETIASLGYPNGARFGAVLPGGSWESKRWSTQGFVAAGKELARGSGRPALVLWGPPEREEASAIAAALGDAGRLAPPTTLRQMAALIARVQLLVAPDCLGRHLALVQGVPTLGVFGSTNPKDWTPPSGPHRTVRAGEGTSLRDLPPDPVLAELRSLLGGGLLDTPSIRP